MLDDELLAALQVEAGRVADLNGEAVDVDQPVPTCPGWGVGRVVGHLGRVHRWATAMMEAERPVFIPPRELEVTVPRDNTVFDWYKDGLAPLYAEFERGPLDAPVHTWNGEQERRWWLRRLTHETAVHRFDVTNAFGTPTPVDAAAATDGIAELFDLFVATLFDAAAFGADHAGQTMHLHCTDVAGEWLVRFEPAEVVVEREHAKGDVAVRGEASDLFLGLWKRLPVDRCEVFGDRSLVDEFLTAASF